ncbi:MAG: hypothetical protein MJB57_16000 [Gemmatimonadetes bacterium]|nr:hypothetical protein [Gemmatimonadota bacterium]
MQSRRPESTFLIMDGIIGSARERRRTTILAIVVVASGVGLPSVAETATAPIAGLGSAEWAWLDDRVAELPCAGGGARAPEVVPMSPTQNAPGGRGSMTLTQPASPFGIHVAVDGQQTYRVAIRVDRLPRRRGSVYVGWVATPQLDEFVRLGTIGETSRVEGSVAWNQFLAFVSEETDPEIERWSGPIVLTGLSPSGRLHTMAGHGPFEGVSCQDYY